MKLLAPITAIIAAASAGQIFTGQQAAHGYSGKTAESYAKSAELYQSGLEYEQHGLYSDQSQLPQAYENHDVTYNSRPASEKTAKILGYKMENNGHSYQYAYETENGIKAQETGETSETGTTTHGAYSYTGDDGHVYTVTYTADEHGFHPQGAHLPTPPPIPEAIQKSLEQNAREEAAGVFDDGQYKEHSGHYKEHPGHGMAQEYQQYEDKYQHLSYQPQSHESGAELAYHAHH